MVFRREKVIVDGVVLRSVAALTNVVPGTFFVEGPDSAPTNIFKRTPDDSPPAGHVVECARRHPLFDSGFNKGWFRVSGLTFRHGANRAQWGMLYPGTQGSRITSNIFAWSNGLGVNINGLGHIFRYNICRNNGQIGWVGQGTNCLLEYNQSLRNYWKGYDPFWEAGGGKFTRTVNTVIRFHEAGFNNGPGIWLDIFNLSNVVDRCVSYSNQMAGVMLEYGTRETVVRNCVLYGNRFLSWTGSGLLAQAASDNTITHNTIFQNDGIGLWLRSDTRADGGSNRVVNNIIAFNATQAPGYGKNLEIRVDGTNVTEALSNTLDGNLYFHGTDTNAHIFYHKNGGSTDTLTTWKTYSGQDPHAVFADPLLEKPAQVGGFRLLTNSPARKIGGAPPINIQEDFDGQPRPTSGADAGTDQWSAARRNEVHFSQDGIRRLADGYIQLSVDGEISARAFRYGAQPI